MLSCISSAASATLSCHCTRITTASRSLGGSSASAAWIARALAELGGHVGTGTGQPGQLPVVASLLADLWERRAGGYLTLRGYAEAGGVAGAVARHVER